ncbi:MAG: CopD family protein [Gemmatimonadaceae bacterium]|nr:CopD family protein [Gemmatimonadaceae bacterium]
MNLTDPLRELLGFLGTYLSLGVVGLRYGVLGPALGRAPDDRVRDTLFRDAGRRASAVGLAGALLATGLTLAGAIHFATARSLPLVEVLEAGQAEGAVRLVCYAVAIVGFAVVIVGLPSGWPLAAVGAIGGALVNVLTLRWATMVNPVHVFAGSIWIGTLFVLLTIAIPTVLAGTQTGGDKARTVADMVNAFSPMALTAVSVLVLSGVVTAVRHLKFVAALWTTSYGITLVLKLCVVAVVLAFGAWNWRRVKPTLGTPEGSDRIRRSATFELAFASLVLIITSVLVSLPSPRLPK